MTHKQGLRFRILRVTMAVVRISSLLPHTQLVSSSGFPGNPTSNQPVVTSISKVAGLRIEIAIRGMTKTDRLRGAIVTESAQPTTDRTDILGGTSFLGGIKTRPNGTGTSVLGGTPQNRPPKMAIRGGIVRHRRVTIKLPV